MDREKNEQNIERQYYNQEITKILRELEETLNISPIDVIYSRRDGLVQPNTVKISIPEDVELKGDMIKIIIEKQKVIQWWVKKAGGKVDFTDRLRTTLDDAVKRKAEEVENDKKIDGGDK